VGLYGACVPLLYAALLFACRHEINDPRDRKGRMVPLADALSFLHDAFKPRWPFYWWPLVEAVRTLFLTGLLAGLNKLPLEPGSVTQLFVGLVVALGFALLQVYTEPYKEPGNNFLAMWANAALVLYFVAALGVQINRTVALTVGGAQHLLDEDCLVAALFITTFVVLLVTSITFLVEARRSWRKKPSRNLRTAVLLASENTIDEVFRDSRNISRVQRAIRRFATFIGDRTTPDLSVSEESSVSPNSIRTTQTTRSI
jgi:hypothetical protein